MIIIRLKLKEMILDAPGNQLIIIIINRFSIERNLACVAKQGWMGTSKIISKINDCQFTLMQHTHK